MNPLRRRFLLLSFVALVALPAGGAETPLFVLAGGGDGDFGRTVAGVGDLNSDGREDFAVGERGEARVRVFDGRTLGELFAVTGSGAA